MVKQGNICLWVNFQKILLHLIFVFIGYEKIVDKNLGRQRESAFMSYHPAGWSPLTWQIIDVQFSITLFGARE